MSTVSSLVLATCPLLLFCAACSRSPSSTSEVADAAGDEVSDASGASYAQGACGSCVATSCSRAWAQCAGDPDCAAYLGCLGQCPPGPGGDADPVCEGACPSAASSAGAQAQAALTQCRTSGAGADCLACGVDASGENPVLREQCPAATSTDASVCKRCIEEHCCEVDDACGTDCEGYIGCMADGGPYTACASSYPVGFPQAESYEACLHVECDQSTNCATDPDPCNQCIYQECPEEYANLRTNPVGALMRNCIGSGAAASTCLAMYPQATALFDAFEVCVSTNCFACQ
jgi:hypothetical protein